MRRRYFIASIGAFILSIALAISPLAALTSQASSQSVSPFEASLIEPDSPYSLPKTNMIGTSTDQGLGLLRSSRSSLPIRYDLRDTNDVTSIKDQNTFGTCWAFSAIAAFESALLQQGRANASDLDLSEMQVAYFTDWLSNASEAQALGAPGQIGEGTELRSGALRTGGNALSATYTIARGTGVISEREAPYANTARTLISDSVEDWYGDLQATSEWDPNATWALDRSLATKSDFQLHEMGFRNVSNVSLADGSYEADPSYIDVMKRDILDHGAVAMSFCLDTGTKTGPTDGFTNTTTGGRFVNQRIQADHMATVIGWDDTFSASNFTNRPSRDGAWIVKNSYGSLSSPTGNVYPWGIDNSGYVYVSYCDASIEDYSWFTPSTVDQESQITLQYDLLGYSSGSVTQLNNASRVLQANIFTAPEDMILKAVSVSSVKNDASVKTSVYLLDDETTAPDAGQLASTETVDLSGQFYSQIDLSDPVSLRKGQRFSVVQEISSAGKWYMSVECGSASNSFNYNGVRARAISNPGESYIMQGNRWDEVSASNVAEPLARIGLKAGNVMIKAFGDPAPYMEEPPEQDDPNTGRTEPEQFDPAADDATAASGTIDDKANGSGGLDHPLNDGNDDTDRNTIPDADGAADVPAGNETDHPLASTTPTNDSDILSTDGSYGSSDQVSTSAAPNTSNVASDPNNGNTLAKTGDDMQIILLIFSFISALASVFFLALGIRRSEF